MQRQQGPFDRYELTPEEMLTARILDANKQAYYQTMLSTYMEQRMQLIFDPKNPIEFAQTDAEFKGQTMLLQLLLDDSQLAQAELLEQNSNNPDSGE